MATSNQIQSHALAPISGTTMTSREIAALVEKDHYNVTRDILKMFEDLGLDALKFEGIYADSRNRDQVEYVLDQELTYTLMAGYSTVMRHRIVGRWLELETKQRKQEELAPYSNTLLYHELKRKAKDSNQQANRQIFDHHLKPHMLKKFPGVPSSVLDPILVEVKTVMTSYYPNNDGDLVLMPKLKHPVASVIDEGRPEAEIREMHRMMYKHVSNPPETVDEMILRLGSKPKECSFLPYAASTSKTELLK